MRHIAPIWRPQVRQIGQTSKAQDVHIRGSLRSALQNGSKEACTPFTSPSVRNAEAGRVKEAIGPENPPRLGTRYFWEPGPENRVRTGIPELVSTVLAGTIVCTVVAKHHLG